MNPFFNGKQSYGAQILTDISYYNSQHHHPEIQPLFAMIFSLCKIYSMDYDLNNPFQ